MTKNILTGAGNTRKKAQGSYNLGLLYMEALQRPFLSSASDPSDSLSPANPLRRTEAKKDG